MSATANPEHVDEADREKDSAPSRSSRRHGQFSEFGITIPNSGLEVLVLLTLAEAQDFVDRWFVEHQSEISELIDVGMAGADDKSLGDVVGRAVSIGIGIATTSMIALIDENNRQWRTRLSRAGIHLP